MKLPSRRWRIVLGAILATLVVAAVLVAVVRWLRPHVDSVTIPAGHGYTLAAEVTAPDGTGPHPLIVMPASWAAAPKEYRLVAKRFAANGYVVVAYAQRGFRPSTGAVDFAQPATQRDASTVIDWALAHTSADPELIGMAGVSYGAGVSLLAAEREPRIKAVVAMSTWTDFEAAFVQNATASTRTLRGLLRTAEAKGQLTSYLAEVQQRLNTDVVGALGLLRAHAAANSPISHVAALNDNGTAVMIANGWQDSIFPPAQLVAFFGALTTPKRLQLALGDHANPELAGLFGRPDKTIDDTLAWFDHYLLGRSTSIDHDEPIQLQDVATGAWHGFGSWPDGAVSADLGAPGSPGSAALHTPASWTADLTTGTDTAATSGPAQYGTPEDYQPPGADLGTLGRNTHALVWSGTAASAPFPVTGSATVRFSIAASSPSATVFIYLYDVAPSGTGRLMTMTPYTATGLSSTSPRSATVRVQPTCWTIPRGDHLAVVVDTVDPRYESAAPVGSMITLSSTLTSPATVSVPIAR